MQAAQEASSGLAFGAVAEAIRELGSVASSQLYATLMTAMAQSQYEAIINELVKAELVEKDNDILLWTGPPPEDLPQDFEELDDLDDYEYDLPTDIHYDPDHDND